MESAHEISRRVRQIERDLTILGAMPLTRAGQDGSVGLQVKKVVPTTLDRHSGNGGPKGIIPAQGKGTPRGLQQVLLTGLCRMGIHSGEWQYLTECACGQERECGRCGAIQARTRHRRQWRYVGDRGCGQTRVCIRCYFTDKFRDRHEGWSEEWDVGGSESAHRCLRCGAVETWSTNSD